MRRNWLLVGWLAGACGYESDRDEFVDDTAPVVDDATLRSFDGCEDATSWLREQARAHVGPYGWTTTLATSNVDPAGAPLIDDGDLVYDDVPAALELDEVMGLRADVIHADGARILALAHDRLHYLELDGDEPAIVGVLDVATTREAVRAGTPWASQMLVAGERVLVIAPGTRAALPAAAQQELGSEGPADAPIVQLVSVDISSPQDMRVISTSYIEGAYVSAQAAGDLARIVVRSVSLPAFTDPARVLESDGTPPASDHGYDDAQLAGAEALALEYNRALIDALALEDLLPRRVREVTAGETLRYVAEPLVACQRTLAASSFSGLGSLSVLTLDMADSATPLDATAVLSSGESVYPTRDGLYVATQPVSAVPLTHIHKFGLSDTGHASYLASGEIPGHVIDRWALSEHRGDLRVASRDSDARTRISVLRERAGDLDLLGQTAVAPGEEIAGVRMIGDIGYAVPEANSPWLMLDLRDPSMPRVGGELALRGHEAYLHPMSDELLIGVGRAEDDNGDPAGALVSLFDVSDVMHPTEVFSATFANGSDMLDVEIGRDAFLYWAPERLVVVPVRSSWMDETSQSAKDFAGAVAYRVDPQSGISLAGVIEHEGSSREIARSLALGADLFTLSASGLRGTAMDAMEETSWVPL